MTEKMLSQKAAKSGKWPWLRLAAALILGGAAALWLFRQPIAGLVGQTVCAQQKLSCKLKIDRLDFGGLTVSGLEVRNPKAPVAALTAGRVAVDLDWASLFSPAATWVGGDDVVVRVDLSGTRPMLGDLDDTVKRFSGTGGKGGTTPRLEFKNLRVIGDTLIGSVEARGRLYMTGPDALEVELTAPPARMGFGGASLQLAGADLKARVKGDVLSGHLKFDLTRFEAPGSQLKDVRLDLAIEQKAGVLKGQAAGSAGTVALKDTAVAGAKARAEIESGAIDLANISFESLMAGLTRLSLQADLGAGKVSGVSWASGALTAEVDARARGGSGGDLTFTGAKVSHASGTVDRLEIAGQIVLSDAAAGDDAQRAFTASGVARADGAALSSDMRDAIANALRAPLEAALPTFGAAAARVVSRGGEQFVIEAPWSLRLDDGGYDVALLSGAAVTAKSGLAASLTAKGEDASVFTWSERARTDVMSGGVKSGEAKPGDAKPGGERPARVAGWRAMGAFKLSGGGGPQALVDLMQASGDGEKVLVSGSARIRPWKVGDDALALEASDLEFRSDGSAGTAKGALTVRLDGDLGGGVWTGGRAGAKIDAAWTADTFTAKAPDGVVIAWEQGKYGGTIIGKGLLRYQSRNALAVRTGEAIGGSGDLAAFQLPVSGESFNGRAILGKTAVVWKVAGGLVVNFDAEPGRFELIQAEGVTPVVINDIVGKADLRDGWAVSAKFTGGQVNDSQVTITDLKGQVDVSGKKGALNGKLTDVTLKIADPVAAPKNRYEPGSFVGQATLSGDTANFSGQFTNTVYGVQVASVSGTHSLKSANGSLTFTPTPLIFRPRGFQPSALSPLLRGPANVTGRMDVSGGAAWSPDGLKAHATADLRGIGFAIASAGVFEGVSGRVEVSDLFNAHSPPGQTITIDKVTLGLPIEKGAIKFQLVDTQGLRLESAEWPFVGGFIRIKPGDIRYGAEVNKINALAVDWDLAKIIELFKVPDLQLEGTLNGDIPVSFSTGSARIDNAVLQASQKGGVIKYGGSTGDAAGQADKNAKMLFDALKNFHYELLKVTLDGDVAGRLILKLGVLGYNPDVLGGAAFDLNISLDSALMSLLNTTSWQDQLVSTVTAPAATPD